MGHFLLSAEAKFSAAHTLPGVDQCDRLHGHLWRIRVTVRLDEGAIGASGMAVDFRDLERLVQGAVADFEHRYLNDVEAFGGRAPTSEHIAQIVARRATEALRQADGRAVLEEVAVWELPEYRVVYRPE